MSNRTQIEQNFSVRDFACLFSVIIPYYYFFVFQILFKQKGKQY